MSTVKKSILNIKRMMQRFLVGAWIPESILLTREGLRGIW